MFPEDPKFTGVERQPDHPLRLTRPQQYTVRSIRRIFRGEYEDSPIVYTAYRPPVVTPDTPNLILVSGDMGVGKDTVVDSIRGDMERLGGIILRPWDVVRRDFWPERAFLSEHIITPETRDSGGEARLDEGFVDAIRRGTNFLTPRKDLRDRHIMVSTNHLEAIVVSIAAMRLLPDHRQIEIMVDPILNRRELKDFVNSRINKSMLTVEEIMFFSLGVPGLVRQLTMSGVGVKEAKEIAAWHIFTNYSQPGTRDLVNNIRRKGLSNPFTDFNETDIRVFEEVDEELSRLLEDAKERRGVMGLLIEAIARRAQLLSRGFIEESPDFKTRESLSFYSRLLEENNRSGPYIEVFVPELDDEIFGRIQAFLQTKSVRLAMFGLSSLWKTQFMLRGVDGSEVISSAFPSEVRRNQERWQGQVGQKQSERQTGSLYLLTYDHPKSSGASIKVGWALESLLQQAGIRYGVKYDVHGDIHFYEPDEKTFKKIESD